MGCSHPMGGRGPAAAILCCGHAMGRGNHMRCGRPVGRGDPVGFGDPMG